MKKESLKLKGRQKCDNKRQEILSAAASLFMEFGFDKVSMDTIAKQTPVSKATLYNHFKNKEEIFSHVINNKCGSIISHFELPETDFKNIEEFLKHLCSVFVNHIYSYESTTMHKMLVSENNEELNKLFYNSGPKIVIDYLIKYFKGLQKRKILNISNPDASAKFLLGMLKGDHYFKEVLNIKKITEKEKTELVNSVVEFFIKGHQI